MRQKRTSRFWKIYLITTAAVLIILAVGLGIFYDFILAYENSQPLNTAEAYVSGLDEETVGKWIQTAAEKLVLEYEDTQTASAACRAALAELEGEFSCRREYGTAADAPVYVVTRGEVPVGRLTLREADGGKYGFPVWEIDSSEAILEYLNADSRVLTVYAPLEGSVSVNGTALSDDVRLAENIPYPFTNPFEISGNASACLYRLDGLYGEANVTCTLNGAECEMRLENGAFWFLYPDSSYTTYTVTAPAGADIWVNNVAVSEEYITASGIRYGYADVEANAENLPTAVTYTIPELFDEPTVRAVLHGEELILTKSETSFSAAYPDKQMYSCTILVPSGSSVFMRGVSCDSYRTGEMEEAYPGLYSDAASAPLYDVFRISGLYLAADQLTVTYNGNQIPVESSDGKSYIAQYPETENESVSALADAFAKDYFTYIAGGYRNTEENLAQALKHVKKGSDLYSSIQRSLVGIQFVTPVSAQVYNTLTITDMRLMPDGSVYCLLEFDIDQTIYYVKRSYSGSLSLICENTDGIWLITEMLTDSNS